jgi:tRNA dimethylallyltransferase
MRFPADLLRRSWFLAGATACGKTATALSLAPRIGAEIVSLDSMAIYRGMDIGTAKPSTEERAAVRHHLIDILDPADDFSVADYLRAAEQACEGIVSRGRAPLFVGGTGMYLRALLRGVFEGPSADAGLRARLQSEAVETSPEALHARLAAVDPGAAARLHPADVRRVIRALEIFELTGRPASEQLAEEPLPEDQRPRRVFWLSPPRSWLHGRINHRVDAMFAAGLVDEVRALIGGGRGLGRTASQALGYKEVIEHLEGRISLIDCINQVKTRTRQFAKRQETWFRNLIEAQPVVMTGQETAEEMAQLVYEAGEAGRRKE